MLMGRIRWSFLALRYQFQLFRLGQFQYLRSCRRLVMGVWGPYQLVSLVVWWHLMLQGELVPCTMACWLTSPTCYLRAILKVGWMGHWLGCILPSSSSLPFPWRFHCICLMTSWLTSHPSCLCSKPFAWHQECRLRGRVLWFIHPLRYQLQILLEVKQS